MKYFIDTEFLEGTQNKRFLGIKYGKTKPTIDLISIGIVAEDGREYYAISKDFNLEEAWNKFEWKDWHSLHNEKLQQKVYWIRENVLKPIFDEWKLETNSKIVRLGLPISLNEKEFNYKNFKYCIECIGKSNQQIAEEIKLFTRTATRDQLEYKGIENKYHIFQFRYSDIKWKVAVELAKDEEEAHIHILKNTDNGKPDKCHFYGYYSDYDWVVFCWLFGKMIDLPKGFPMYCIDLKQELDNKINLMKKYRVTSTLKLEVIDFLSGKNITFGEAEKMDWDKWFKEHPNYPKQTNEHNALSNAKWNYELYKFLNTI